eukprot:3586804-Pyramimonas_sp.AAC.1
MMAMFEISNNESDVSDRPMQPTGEVDCNEIADVAAANSNDNGLKLSTDYPREEAVVDRNERYEERLKLEYCCGPNSKIGDPRNFVDNSCR